MYQIKYYAQDLPRVFNEEVIQKYLPEYPVGAMRDSHTIMCRATSKDEANQIVGRTLGVKWNFFTSNASIFPEESVFEDLCEMRCNDKSDHFILPYDACRQHRVVIQLCNVGLYYSLEKIITEDEQVNTLKTQNVWKSRTKCS